MPLPWRFRRRPGDTLPLPVQRAWAAARKAAARPWRSSYAAATGRTVRRADPRRPDVRPDRRIRQTSAIAARRSSSASTRARTGSPPSAAKANRSWIERRLRNGYTPFPLSGQTGRASTAGLTAFLAVGLHRLVGRRSRRHRVSRRPRDNPSPSAGPAQDGPVRISLEMIPLTGAGRRPSPILLSAPHRVRFCVRDAPLTLNSRPRGDPTRRASAGAGGSRVLWPPGRRRDT